MGIYTEMIDDADAEIARAVAAERERCAKIADEYFQPGRFGVSDAWKEHTPEEVYNTAAVDVAGWIAAEIRNPKSE